MPCLTNDKNGWFGRRSKSVDSTKSRGNFCFKFFDAKQKTLEELRDYCGRYSSRLVTNNLINARNSTLKEELNFVMEKKLRLELDKFGDVYGVNANLQGAFLSMIY